MAAVPADVAMGDAAAGLDTAAAGDAGKRQARPVEDDDLPDPNRSGRKACAHPPPPPFLLRRAAKTRGHHHSHSTSHSERAAARSRGCVVGSHRAADPAPEGAAPSAPARPPAPTSPPPPPPPSARGGAPRDGGIAAVPRSPDDWKSASDPPRQLGDFDPPASAAPTAVVGRGTTAHGCNALTALGCCGNAA